MTTPELPATYIGDPEGYRGRATVMSNMGHHIDYALAERLATEESWAVYTGWDFNGRVWMDHKSEQWACQVWVYHELKEVVLASTLEELMTAVSEKYGRE